MRISSINVAQPRNVNYKLRQKNVQTPQMQVAQPAFKGWKAGAGSLIGTLIGGAAGVFLTCGLGVVPFVLAGAGAIAGGECGKSRENHDKDDYDRTPYYPLSRD